MSRRAGACWIGTIRHGAILIKRSKREDTALALPAAPLRRADEKAETHAGESSRSWDGSDPAQLTDDPAADGSPTGSADGERIVFHSDRAGNDEIYVMDADGSGQLRLSNNPEDFLEHRGVDDFPAW